MSPNVEGFVYTCDVGDCSRLAYKYGQCREHYAERNRDMNRARGNWTKKATWKRVRRAVLIRDDYQCQIQWRNCEGTAITADHIVSVLDGGDRYDMDNLQAACEKCNSAKEIKDRQTRDYAEIGRRQHGTVG